LSKTGELPEISPFNIRIIKDIKNISLLFRIIFRCFLCGPFGGFYDAPAQLQKTAYRELALDVLWSRISGNALGFSA